MKYKSVRGMEDIMAPEVTLWQELERKARASLESGGYSEIRTPILEETAVFVRGIGETTDIVSKEMYTFADRKGRSLSMRPEGTAPIVRAYIEHGMYNVSAVQRLYYMGPMFRSERPQKGRTRQFYQIGVEVIGSNSVFADVEILVGLDRMLKCFGLCDFKIKLNNLGCKKDKENFACNLKEYFNDKRNALCEDCRIRMDKNVLRVLDCKNEDCAKVVKHAPKASEYLCQDCRSNFENAQQALKALGVVFEVNGNLVRGLDYYTGTVFELTHPALGSQDAIGAGGRYDNLVNDMGGPKVGAVGYALGVERLVLALKGEAVPITGEKNVLYIASMTDEARIEGMRLAEEIEAKIPGVVILKDISASSLKSQMRSADKSMAKLVLLLGEDEMKEHKVTIKEMASARQTVVDRNKLIEEIRRRIC